MRPRRKILLGHGLSPKTQPQAMRPRRKILLGHGLSPYKKAKEQIFLREQAPDKIYSLLFCMACGFRKFMLDKVGMGMIYCSSSLWRGVRVV